jgi:lambda family phage portal protein
VTLAEAQTLRTAAFQAVQAALRVQSYTVGDRSKVNADLQQAEATFRKYDNLCTQLAAGRRGARVVRAVPVDTLMGLLSRAAAAVEGMVPSSIGQAVASVSRQILAYRRHGASHNKTSTRGWYSFPGGPDVDIIEPLEVLRSRSRDLYMSEPLAIGALRAIRSNEIGSGLRLNAQIDAEALGMTDEQALAWEANTEREFALWANTKTCDAERRGNFGQLQALARLSQLMSGDVFALLHTSEREGERYDLRIQLIEADRVCNPETVPIPSPLANVYGGVEIGEFGEPVAYWIRNSHPGDAFSFGPRLVTVPKWERVPAFGAETGRPMVLHLMEQERPGQRRGVPILAPVMERLKQISRYTEAEIMAAVVSGFFTAVVTSDKDPTVPIEALQLAPGRDGRRHPAAAGQPGALGNGSIIGLEPGEKIDELNPTRPNAGFEPFVMALCRQIGAGLGHPLRAGGDAVHRQLLGEPRRHPRGLEAVLGRPRPGSPRTSASRSTSSGSRRPWRAAA